MKLGLGVLNEIGFRSISYENVVGKKFSTQCKLDVY